jgi:hypothetical protein
MQLLPTNPREKRLLVVFAAIVVLAGAFLVFRSRGGGDDQAGAGDLPGSQGSVSVPTESASPEPAPSPTLVFDGRDPFEPLFAPVQTSASPTDTGSSPAPTDTGTPAPSAPGTPSPEPSQTSTPPGGPHIDIEGHTITLLDIWTVDGVDWVSIFLQNEGDDGAILELWEGQDFEYVFKVTDVEDPCASFMHGEMPFTLCFE